MSTSYADAMTSISPILTPLAESPPASDPAEQARLQLVSRRGQAGGSSMSRQQNGGGPVQLEQGQVVVVRLIIIVVVKMDPLNSCHLLCGAAAVEEEFTQVHRPH